MTSISRNNRLVTLVNVFEVEPENQQKLLDILVEATRKTFKHLPGFVSANLHKSLDGRRVVNYAQWRSKEDFETMLRNPEAQPHMREALDISRADPHLYEVSFVEERG
jgi:quinol monooxygenase YgiN